MLSQVLEAFTMEDEFKAALFLDSAADPYTLNPDSRIQVFRHIFLDLPDPDPDPSLFS